MNDYVIGFSGGPGPFSLTVIAIMILLVAVGWVVLAVSRFTLGGVVEHPQRVPQLYGYAVCLIALLVGLTSVKGVLESSLTLMDPTYSSTAPWNNWAEPSVTSFEAFRATYDRMREMRIGANEPRPEPLSDAELQRRYEALRADRIERNRVGAKRTLIVSLFSLVLATAIGVAHWRWLRSRHPAPA
jgi:uncharacterized membrane protein YidH (DUF202 family)